MTTTPAPTPDEQAAQIARQHIAEAAELSNFEAPFQGIFGRIAKQLSSPDMGTVREGK